MKKRYVWAAVFAAAGAMHFVRPEVFDRIVPLPRPRAWTYGSGAVELALAVGLAARYRHAGAVGAAFLAAVWPANMYMAWQWRTHPSPWARALVYARVPLQIPLMLSLQSLAA